MGAEIAGASQPGCLVDSLYLSGLTNPSGMASYLGSPMAMTQSSERDQLLAELRLRHIQGAEAVDMRTSEERFLLPEGEELKALRILCLEPGAYPRRMGQIAALFLDVTQGWRSLPAARAVLEREASPANAPPWYCSQLNSIANRLLVLARDEEALTLSTLVGVAAEKAHGRASVEWVQAITVLVQSASASWYPFNEKLADVPALTDELIARARELGHDDLLAAALSASGQFWHRVAQDCDDSELLQELFRAERELRESAQMREGPDLGRTLASLAQVQANLASRDGLADEVVAATAQMALKHINRDDRPLQWLAARQLAHKFGDLVLDAPGLNGSDFLAIRDRHSENVARECLALYASELNDQGRASPAADLIEELWEVLHVRECPHEQTLARLLSAAVHSLDRGTTPCRPISSGEDAELFAATEQLPPLGQVAARLHLAVDAPDGGASSAWAIQQAPLIGADLEESALRDAMVFALAIVHGRRSSADWKRSDPAFLFRCSLLSAMGFARLNLLDRAKGALSVGLVLLEDWTASLVSLPDARAINQARSQLEGVLDGCRREASRLDGELGDMGREWLLRVGRVLSSVTHSGVTASPVLATMHSLAFKGALSAEMQGSSELWVEEEGPRQTRREIARLDHLRLAADEQSREAPHPFDEELRLCAWLHDAERQSGETAGQLRRNLQARYDEMLIKALRRLKDPLASGGPSSENAPLDEGFERTAVLDLYLGRDAAGRYTCHSILRLPQGMGRYSVSQAYDEIGPVSDPADEHASLLLDGLAPLVASVRHRIQEAPGARLVSREGAAALMAASQNVLGWDGNDLRELLASGCDHIAICPHGPLAFLPFHLLPIENSLLADSFTVTTIPFLGALFATPRPNQRKPAVELGIVASSDGGVPFDLHAEPRLAAQARELASLTASSKVLANGEATPHTALALLGQSRYAHIASHGSGLGQVPSFHCLYLDRHDDLDGRLFAEQIMRSDLRGLELVTLCACETALGRVDPAGNIRGLPFALMVAGAQSVVATLWPVAAEPALHFFSVLHRELAADVGRLEAFRAAQISCRERHPRFADWGAFVYIGSWR
jgi:hypothetical protein